MSNIEKRINYENFDWDKSIEEGERLIKEWNELIEFMKLIRNEVKKSQREMPLTYQYFLVKEEMGKMKRQLNSSTERVSYNQKLVENWKVKFPSWDLIDKFDKFSKPIFEAQKKNEEIIRKLEQLQKAWIESLN